MILMIIGFILSPSKGMGEGLYDLAKQSDHEDKEISQSDRSSFDKRVEFFVFNPQVNVLENYVIKIPLKEENLFISHQSIKVTDSKGKMLNYYLEKDKNYLWVRVEELSSDMNQFFLYLGHDKQKNGSDPVKTFFYYQNKSQFNDWNTLGSASLPSGTSAPFTAIHEAYKSGMDGASIWYQDLSVPLERGFLIEFSLNKDAPVRDVKLGIMDKLGNGYSWVYQRGTEARLKVEKSKEYKTDLFLSELTENMEKEFHSGKIIIEEGPEIHVEHLIEGKFSEAKTLFDSEYQDFSRIYFLGNPSVDLAEIRIRPHTFPEPKFHAWGKSEDLPNDTQKTIESLSWLSVNLRGVLPQTF